MLCRGNRVRVFALLTVFFVTAGRDLRGETSSEEAKIEQWLNHLVGYSQTNRFPASFLAEGRAVLDTSLRLSEPVSLLQTPYTFYLEDAENGFDTNEEQRQVLVTLVEFMLNQWPPLRSLDFRVDGTELGCWHLLSVSGPEKDVESFARVFEFLVPRLGALLGPPFKSR